MNNTLTGGFKTPSKLTFVKTEKALKRVMIYGFDGTGKSEFAQKYCDDHKLTPVVFDFDQTNFSSENKIKIPNLRNALQYKEYFIDIIKEVKSSDFDTIIFDNVSFFFELLVGTGKGMSKYSERGEYWKEIKKCLLKSGLNLIWIGQIDTDITYEKNSKDKEKTKPSSVLVSIHALSNEKYCCEYSKLKGFTQVVKKYRNHEEFLDKTYDEIKDEVIT